MHVKCLLGPDTAGDGEDYKMIVMPSRDLSLIIMIIIIFINLFIFKILFIYLLAAPRGMWDLSSPTRD